MTTLFLRIIPKIFSLRILNRTCSSKSKNEWNAIANKVLDKDTSKKDWNESKDPQYYINLRNRAEDNGIDLIKIFQGALEMSTTSIKNWYLQRNENKLIADQVPLLARTHMLGADLAAAHFLLHRGGSVKFHDEPKWIKANERNLYTIPNQFVKDLYLEAIDCSDMPLYYEGLSNFRNLEKLEWFSLNGCLHMDDWCIDRVSAMFRNSLIYLDLRGCPKITHRGLGALYKLRHLKLLFLDDDVMTDASVEMTCLLLQQANPLLKIKLEKNI